MKRLILVFMMFMFGCIHAEDGDEAATELSTTQSATETTEHGEDSLSVAIENIHQIDLDNTETDGSGNWLNKRIWYNRSQAAFDEIRVMVSAVRDLRIQFSNEVNAVGQKIDSFFETVDFTKSQLDDKFREILTALETEKKLVGDLSSEERELEASIKQELGTIDQIGKDIKSIGEVDNKIDQTLMQAFKTIDECRDYETKAWESFKAVGKELDDKKARNFYYQMSNYKQNIEQKSSYLKATLLPYLHNVLVAKVESNISKINQAIEQLKTKGLDLEKLMKKTEEDDVSQIKDREKEAIELAVKKAREEEQVKAQQAAEKAAKELEAAKKKSFSNVMHHYYETTIGKIVGFIHQGYSFVAKLFGVEHVAVNSKPYSYPVITYISHGINSVKVSMHHLVEYIMGYFGGVKSKIKAVEAKIEEKVVEKISEKVSEKIAEKIEEKREKVAHQEVKAESVEDSSTETPKTDQQTSEKTSDTDTSSSNEPVTTSTQETSSNDVVVQSLKSNQNQQEYSGYHIFKTVFDLIGTIFMSLYNCLVQFFKLIFNFSAYVTSP